ncbi:MAG: polysaccharide deacetylase family protein [Candidatus Aminicenantes bacterium]
MKSRAIILFLIVVEFLFCPVLLSSRPYAESPYPSQNQTASDRSVDLNSRVSLPTYIPQSSQKCILELGAIIRGDTDKKRVSFIFTGGDFSDGGATIKRVLKEEQIPGSFFFTGDFYRNPANTTLIKGLITDGHYLGPHSDKHLLYCSWEDRKETLITKQEFVKDIQNNYAVMARFGVEKKTAIYFIPPFEWYNTTIAAWTKELGLTLINFTPGTLSTSDYTTPEMDNYKTSDLIYSSIIHYEKTSPCGLNGFLLLLHIGTHPDRTDKFYSRLADLIHYLKQRNYTFLRVDHLLKDCE